MVKAMIFYSDESVGFIMNKTNMRLKNELAQNIKPHGVTPEQWGILNRLWEKDGISQKDLSGKSFKDQPTTARILDILEKKGLVERRANPADRRTYLLFLTDEGLDLRNRLVPLALKTLEKALKGFSKEEVDKLMEWLNKIYSNLD